MESSSPSSLIPGLTDDVAELCLSRIPRCDFRIISQVCRRWRTFLKSKHFSAVRKLTGPVEEFMCVLMKSKSPEDGSRWVEYLYGEVFDASGNNLGQIPSVPGPLKSQFGVAVLGGGKIVLVGGYAEVEGFPIDGTTRISASADAYEFDPATNSWRKLAGMNVPRREFAFAVVGGLLYVIRGFSSDGECLQSSEVYDPETNHWSLMDDCPDCPDFHRAFAFSFKSKLFVVGNESRFIDIYDPRTETWKELDSGQSLSVYSYTVVRNKVYFSDHNSDYKKPELGVFDPEENSWSSVSVPRCPGAYWCKVGEWNNKVILVSPLGGRTLIRDLDKENASKWRDTHIKPSGSNPTIVLINF
ncbi:unnamed protein product [Brassica rapa subsp. narinosa]